MPHSKTFHSTRRTYLKQHLVSCALLLLFSLLPFNISAQQRSDKNRTTSTAATTPAAPALTRTTTRHETRRFGYGSTLTIVGAPAGSITVEAWERSEIDVTADIELRADTEEDLALLATVNSFVFDEDANHIRLLSTGTHDKVFMKRVAKKFPKKLLNLPWKIDYRVRVPIQTDVDINAGRGTFTVTGVEGAIYLRALEGDARLTLTGGTVDVTIGRGTINLSVLARSWRGAGANLQLAAGDITLSLPAGFNAEINAEILRTGQIENSYTGLQPQERTQFTPKAIKGRAGAGGPRLSFTIGDGTLRIKQEKQN